MRRFKNILVIADCADKHNAVFERAAHLALRNRALLIVACIIVKPDAFIPGEDAEVHTCSLIGPRSSAKNKTYFFQEPIRRERLLKKVPFTFESVQS